MDLFTAAPSGSTRMSFTLPGRPFSRTYGANLPSSLTIVSSLTSVFSTCPPVSVVGTGTYVLPRGFSRRHGFRDRSEEHTSELQSHVNLVCRLLLEKKNKNRTKASMAYRRKQLEPLR